MNDRLYPDRPIAAVGAALWRDDKVLLIQRSKPPLKGGWSIPGGKLELGETLRDGIKREILEETNLNVRIGPIIDVVDFIEKDDSGAIVSHYALVDFLAFWQSGEAKAGSDAAAVKWVTLDDLAEIDLWGETRRIIEQSAEMITSRAR